MHPSGSFTVEKCFNASDVPLREVIVSDLLAVQRELSKTKQGPLLLRNLDVDGFSRRPEQWRSRQNSKISVYKDFLAEFVEAESISRERKNPPVDSSKKASQPTNPPIDSSKKAYQRTNPPVDSSKKASQPTSIKTMRQEIDSALASFTSTDASKEHKKQKKARKNKDDNNVEQKPSPGKKKRKHHQKDDLSNSSQKKLKS